MSPSFLIALMAASAMDAGSATDTLAVTDEPVIVLEEEAAPGEIAAVLEPAPSGRIFVGSALLAAAGISEFQYEFTESDADDDISGPVGIPDPEERRQKRIRAKSKRTNNRYKLRERRYGVALQPGYAMLQGDVIGQSFTSGFAFTVRGIAAIGDANRFFFDIGYSRHDMQNPRAMFFRTAVTSSSSFSGVLQIWSPAIYYAYVIPFGAGFHSRAFVLPRIYFGLGPLLTFASGTVTNAGSKGTVTGQGSQPFLQFTPGFGMDVRVLEWGFVGFDLRYRITLPTRRPDQTKEFAIPKVYVFEPALSFSYMFY